MKFPIFGLASVDIRPLPGAWVVELLGVVLGVQDHKKIKFLMTVKGSRRIMDDATFFITLLIDVFLYFSFVNL